MKSHILDRGVAPSPETSFRLLLRQELARRCAKNARYSLRAFAKALDVEHATLSQLLSGRRRLTARTIRELGAALGLPDERVAAYVEAEHLLAAGGADDAGVRRLAHDTASVVADWYHHAILELTHLDGFVPSAPWIARVLGIRVDEVNIALARLLRLGLLRMTSPEKWDDLSGNALFGIDALRSAALAHLQEQLVALAMAASSVPSRFREISATTIAVRTADIPAAIDELARFRKSLCEGLASSAGKDDVYQLQIQLFPITRLKKETPP